MISDFFYHTIIPKLSIFREKSMIKFCAKITPKHRALRDVIMLLLLISLAKKREIGMKSVMECVSYWKRSTRQLYILVPGTGKSHQNTSAGKFDPERAVWNCWLLALFNDVIVYDVTTHITTLPATSPPLSMALNVKYFEQIHLKPHSISGTRKIINYLYRIQSDKSRSRVIRCHIPVSATPRLGFVTSYHPRPRFVTLEPILVVDSINNGLPDPVAIPD